MSAEDSSRCVEAYSDAAVRGSARPVRQRGEDGEDLGFGVHVNVHIYADNQQRLTRAAGEHKPSGRHRPLKRLPARSMPGGQTCGVNGVHNLLCVPFHEVVDHSHPHGFKQPTGTTVGPPGDRYYLRPLGRDLVQGS